MPKFEAVPAMSPLTIGDNMGKALVEGAYRERKGPHSIALIASTRKRFHRRLACRRLYPHVVLGLEFNFELRRVG